jgi:plastocyanin
MSPDTTFGGVTTILIKEKTFEPRNLTIRAGDTVFWINTSQHAHTVTSNPVYVRRPRNVQTPSGATPFDSGEIKGDGTFHETLTVPGVYRYVCSIHEDHSRIGTITVTASNP